MIENYSALILTVRSSIEFNFTTIYRWAFLGEVADAIEKTKDWSVKIYDGAVKNAHLDDYIELLKEKFDLILFYTDPHTVSYVKKISEFCKAISPKTKILVYGRATIFLPHYFFRHPFDAVHVSGDREIIIQNYCRFLSKKLPQEKLTGIVLINHNSLIKTPPGILLPESPWFSPALQKLPIQEYKELYAKKNRTFEYGITVSRGCEKKCEYCETWRDQGTYDRRRNSSEILNWINQINDPDRWIVQLWSSNFFQDRKWVLSFCADYLKTLSNFSWRVVGSYQDLDAELIKEIAQCNCVEIAVGVETFFSKTEMTLKGPVKKLLEINNLCKENAISLKCLLMIGLPNQTEEDVLSSINILRSNEINFRFSAYTPLQKLRFLSINELDKLDLADYDRRTFFDPASKIRKELIITTISNTKKHEFNSYQN